MLGTETLVVVPKTVLDEMMEMHRKNTKALEDLRAVKTPEFVTRAEFMKLTAMSQTKFATVVKQLQHTRQGKTVYIPYSEVLRYLRGEIRIA
jgi:hypothetical protein